MLLVIRFSSGLRLTLDDLTPVRIECPLCDHSVAGPARESVPVHNQHCISKHPGADKEVST